MGNRLSKESRAGQFAPFDALKGLTDELKRRELKNNSIAKIELSDEQSAEISSTLAKLNRDDLVKITFYYKGFYVTIEQNFKKIDQVEGYIFVNENTIPIIDLYNIEILEKAENYNGI